MAACLPLPRRARGHRERTARTCRKADRRALALQRWPVELRRQDAPLREADGVARAARHIDAADATDSQMTFAPSLYGERCGLRSMDGYQGFESGGDPLPGKPPRPPQTPPRRSTNSSPEPR